MKNKIRVNLVSESEISVQGHGVHTAYEEMARSLENRPDIELIKGRFGETVDCDILHIHTVGPRTYRKLLQKGVKKVVSAHVVPDSFIGSLLFAKAWKPLAKIYLRWFYNKADLLLAVSDETKRDLENLRVTAPIEVMYNSIDITRYVSPVSPRAEMRKKLGIAADAFVVIGAGQVQPRKRVNDFIAAAKKDPKVTFVWVGGMPFGKLAADNVRMQKMIDTAPKNMIFAGIVPLETMSSYYHAADMFWLPSEQETFGLVVVEAAASGLPIMLRDISDYDTTFGNDALKHKTIDDAVKNITHLEQNKVDYKKWQKAAQRIAQKFDSKASADQLVKLYKSLL